MRKDFGSNPWFYPLPVLIVGTCDESGRPDAMNAAKSAFALQRGEGAFCLQRNERALILLCVGCTGGCGPVQ